MKQEIKKIILNGLKHSQRSQQLNVSDKLIFELSEKLSENLFRKLEIVDTTERKVFESLVFSMIRKHSGLDFKKEENSEMLAVRIASLFYGDKDEL